MKRRVCLLMLCYIAGVCLSTACAALRKRSSLPDREADSVMRQVYLRAERYARQVGEFRADLYTKAHLNVEKKNFLFRYIPSMLRGERGVNEYILETQSDVHYTAPNIYDQKINVLSGTLRNEKSIPGLVNYFNVNIYSPYLFGDKLLSPLGRNASRYYMYHLDYTSRDSLGRRLFHISFMPRNKSFQLMSGDMVVTDSVWSVRHFHFKGRQEQLTFDCHLEMGQAGTEEETLPVRYELTFRYVLLRNRVTGHYTAVADYREVKRPEEQKQRKGYNLSASFSLQCDPRRYNRTDMMPDSLRRAPLTPDEVSLYTRKGQAQEDTTNTARKIRRRKERWEKVGEFLVEDYKWNVADKGTFRSMALLNPMLFSFSRSNGIAYRSNLKYRGKLPGQRSIGAQSNVGYNFKLKEFYWRVNGDLTYCPRRNGRVTIEVGNGNRIYSSDVLDDLKSIPDSAFNFDKLNLELFKDFYVSLNHGIEVCNGLRVDVGLNIHRRTPVKRPEMDVAAMSAHEEDVEQAINSHIRSAYVSFAPRLRVAWTPGQYYYMNGRQKINWHSRFPTFIVDYERGIQGVFKSTLAYERIELDMQHKVRLGVTRNLFYRLGGGLFTNQKQTYFVDFENFRSNNLPLNWNDDIGGVFQALDSRWYNASNHYVRANLVYESPFFILRHLMKYTGYVQHERLYVNVLSMPHLRPYVELGYGIGTHVFDVGVFVSNSNYTDFGFGWKFVFGLFK